MTQKEFNHPAYVNIPFFVLQDRRLDFFNKILFSFFWSFAVAGKKVRASNEYLAELFCVSDKYIQSRIKMLEELNFIKRTTIKYKRVIEINHLVLTTIDEGSDSPNLKLVPPTVGVSTNIELPPTTVGVSHQPQLVPAPTTVGTYNKAIPKNDIKIPPISPKGEKKELFSLAQMLEDNPFQIPESMISDWLEVRKSKKAKMTSTAWKGTNSVLSKLKDAGLNPIECFEGMVASGWQGIKVSYFEKEIAALKPKAPLKYVPKEDRAAEYERITAREKAAEQAKKAEIAAAGSFKEIVKQSQMNKAERDAAWNAKRIEMGMTVSEYSAYVLSQAAKNPNNG